MTRTTTFIIETTGGSPTFHIPFPISSLAALASSSSSNNKNNNNNPHENENVKFLFRNSGGRPTFHVGGAEVGVSSAEAWDYATVVEAVMGQRRKRLPLGLGTPNVRVKVEEETPGVAMVGSGKGKGKEKEKERPIENVDEDPSTSRSRLPSPAAAQRRQFTREELHALARGSLAIDSIDRIENDGRQDFLYTIDPTLPPDRPLAADEQAEWTPLWNDLLHLDRVFCGPLRGAKGVAKGKDKMSENADSKTPENVNGKVLEEGIENGKGKGNVKEKNKITATRTEKEQVQGREKETEKPWPPPRVRSKVKENNAVGALASSSNTLRHWLTKLFVRCADPSPSHHHEEVVGGGFHADAEAEADVTTAKPKPKPKQRYKTAYTNTPELHSYMACIPDIHSFPSASTSSISPTSAQPTTSTSAEPTILTPAERTWLSAQTEFARPPGWWRPVRWLALGERMHGELNGREDPIRPLYHGVLLEAWDRGEWRFHGHEGVGRVGVPWGEWVRGEEGRRWVAGAR
ncbi:hypothetical protein R3P38DRAFT_2660404 [Favolaschia claudopus]|uniref:Uncharacterized protein n=1 Tax=Favolaschia claudopus TaxID=2862362 RepID=A0AAV9ZQF5_9AGAR